MPGVGEQQHGLRRSAIAATSPGSRARLHDLVEGDHPPGEGDPEVGGQPVQPAGVLDGQHVGGGHHRAQPRTDVARAARGVHRPARVVPSPHEPVTQPAGTYPGAHGGAGPRAGGRARPPPAGRAAAGRAGPRRQLTPRRCPTDRALSWVLTAVLGRGHPSSAGCGTSATPATCSSTRPTTRPRPTSCSTLGLRVQPRLHVHRPPAAGQVADRRRGVGSSATTALGWRFPSAGRRDRRRRRPDPAGPPADRLDPARAGRRAAAGAGRLLVHPRPDRPARRLPAGLRGRRGGLPGRRPRPGAGPGPGARRRPATGFGSARAGWRIAAGVLFGCACAVKWSGVCFLAFFAVLAVLGPRRLARRRRPQPDPHRAAPRAARARVWALAALPVLTYLATLHRLVPRRDLAGHGTGRSRTRTPPVPSSRTRCARCGTCTPSG